MCYLNHYQIKQGFNFHPFETEFLKNLQANPSYIQFEKIRTPLYCLLHYKSVSQGLILLLQTLTLLDSFSFRVLVLSIKRRRK